MAEPMAKHVIEQQTSRSNEPFPACLSKVLWGAS